MNFALDFFGLPVATRANVIIPLLIGPPGDAAAIADGTIANAKLANVATATFKGRTTSGSGAPEDLTATQATALLNPATSSLKGLMAAADFSKLAGITSTKQTEWDTAYTQTRQWGGGATGLDAATARTNLGLSSIPVLLPVVAASNLAAGSTFYFGPLGPQTTNTLAPWSIAGKTGTITGFQISTGAFPGSGQTYTYTIFKNGSATAITGTITGGASNTISVTGGSVSVSGYDNFQLQLVTSAGAAATLHSGNVVLYLDI